VKDLFWWVFENTFQPNVRDQQKLLRRVAQDYMHLLSCVKHPHYGETFLKVIFSEFFVAYIQYL